MKILLVNNFYYNRGGDCTYLFSLKRLLEEKGHKVIIFSMHHPQNFESEYSKYFVSYINYADMAKNKSLSSGLKVLFRSIYSREAKKKMEKLIETEKPDIAHLNNIRQHVTTSILPVLKKNKIPIVWTLHDYQLICPNITFLSRGKICEKCKKRKYYWPVLTKCKKNSFLASMMAAVEHSIQMFSNVYDNTDVFICPSEFLKNKYIEYGFNEKKLSTLRHFIDNDRASEYGSAGDYLLYAGRLSEEKGVRTLIDAVNKLRTVKLKIVGDGLLKEELMAYVRSIKLENMVEFCGHRSHEEVEGLIKKCLFVVLPSEWYEVFGLVVLEAFACGKPVVASRIGGVTEFIKDGADGLTFEPGNVEDLSLKIDCLAKNPGRVVEMGEAGRSFVTQEMNAEIYYAKLMEIYKRAISVKS